MNPTEEKTSRRVEANRRNAARSTGPKTASGKSQSRLNALKHGLTATTAVLPGEDASALQSRVEAWKDDIGPRGALEDYLVERAALVSWQLDRADRTIAARLADRMQHHDRDQEAREADEVADLARRLFWDPLGPIGLYPHISMLGVPPRLSTPDSVDDPLNPSRIVNRLESTAAGCRWLLDRWGDLRKLLDDGLRWTPPDRLRAIRLMGRQPMDCLEDDRVMAIYLACGAMNPDGEHEFLDLCTELETGGERVRFIDRVRDRQPYRWRPSTPEAGKALLLDFIDQAVTRLEALLRAHQDRQAPERPGALDRLAFDNTPDGELLRRYQTSHGRMLLRTIHAIFKVRKATEERGCEEPEPAAVEPGPSSPVEPPAHLADETNPSPPGEAPVAIHEEVNWPRVLEKAGVPTVPASPDGPEPMESRPAEESVPSLTGETNPTPADRPALALPLMMDPCSEGRHVEPAIDPTPPIRLVGTRPKKARRAKSEQRPPGQPIPPVLIHMFRQLLHQKAIGAPLPAIAAGPASDAGPP